MIAETGSTGDVPPTVQGVIAARLDVLPAREKTLLQDASVLGKVFWRGGVEALGSAVSEDVLVSLTRRELLRRARTSTVAGETEFAFRHALVRDVAYGQIPRAARAEKHRRAGEWIDATAATRADLVAHHYLEALHLTEAAGGDAGPLREPARVALTRAGDRARSLGAPERGARPLPARARARARRPRAAARGLVRRIRLRRLGSRRGAARPHRCTPKPATPARPPARRSRSPAASGCGATPTGAQTAIADAVEQARRAGDGAVLGEALEEQARGLMTGGRNAEALAAAEEAIAYATRHDLERTAVHARVTYATALGNQGDHREPAAARGSGRGSRPPERLACPAACLEQHLAPALAGRPAGGELRCLGASSRSAPLASRCRPLRLVARPRTARRPQPPWASGSAPTSCLPSSTASRPSTATTCTRRTRRCARSSATHGAFRAPSTSSSGWRPRARPATRRWLATRSSSSASPTRSTAGPTRRRPSPANCSRSIGGRPLRPIPGCSAS